MGVCGSGRAPCTGEKKRKNEKNEDTKKTRKRENDETIKRENIGNLTIFNEIGPDIRVKAAPELLTRAVANLIRENDIHQIPTTMQMGS